jgi:hypothetical protein
MKSFCLIVALLIAPAFSVESSLTFDAEAAKNRPVSKVITLVVKTGENRHLLL